MLRIRVPVDVKRWLEAQAAKNLRSMNAEVVVSLRDRMERPGMPPETKTAGHQA